MACSASDGRLLGPSVGRLPYRRISKLKYLLTDETDSVTVVTIVAKRNVEFPLTARNLEGCSTRLTPADSVD